MELDAVFVRTCDWLGVFALTHRSLFTSGSLIGFDASGHIAEETRHAKYIRSCPRPSAPFLTLNYSVTAARGMLTTALLTGIMGFLTIILLLFCIPDLDTLFALNAPQPFIQVYALALGKGPSVFMTVLGIIGIITVSPL